MFVKFQIENAKKKPDTALTLMKLICPGSVQDTVVVYRLRADPIIGTNYAKLVCRQTNKYSCCISQYT